MVEVKSCHSLLWHRLNLNNDKANIVLLSANYELPLVWSFFLFSRLNCEVMVCLKHWFNWNLPINFHLKELLPAEKNICFNPTLIIDNNDYYFYSVNFFSMFRIKSIFWVFEVVRGLSWVLIFFGKFFWPSFSMGLFQKFMWQSDI